MKDPNAVALGRKGGRAQVSLDNVAGVSYNIPMMNETKRDRHSHSPFNYQFNSQATYVVKDAIRRVLSYGGADWKERVEKLERVCDHLESTAIGGR